MTFDEFTISAIISKHKNCGENVKDWIDITIYNDKGWSFLSRAQMFEVIENSEKAIQTTDEDLVTGDFRNDTMRNAFIPFWHWASFWFHNTAESSS